jgi:hypothetical protein
MKKVDLGQVITIFANIGVIAGIVFLGFEIRQSTAVAQASSYQQSTEKMADVRATIASDPELVRLWTLYVDQELPDDLDRESVLRLGLMVGNMFGAIEDAYFARQYGILGDAEWERMQNSACNQFRLTTGTRVARAIFISPEFEEFLDSAC